MSYNFTKEQIEHAYDVAGSAIGAARLLCVKIDTYKKYAEMYECYRKNQSGKGTHKHRTFIENPDINIHYFDVIDSPDKAYILGYLLADGTVKCNSLRLNISIRDREILEYICNKLNVDESEIIDYFSSNRYKGVLKRFPSSRISIISRHLVRTLESYGLVVNRVLGNVDLFSNIPEDMMMPCLSRYIDGNGSIANTSYNISITSNYITCDRISEYLKKFGISHTYIQDRGKYAELCFSGNIQFLQTYLSSNEFLLRRKMDSANSMLYRRLYASTAHNTSVQKLKRIPRTSNVPKLINTCVDCNAYVSVNSVRCKSCAASYRQRDICNRPSKSILISDLLLRNFSIIASKYGVSDNAIRKWCKYYSLPYSTRTLKSMSDEDILNL